MPWVRFVRDFDWYPPACNGRYCLAYKAGPVALLVTTACATAALARGAAVRAKKTVKAKTVKDNGNGTRPDA